MKNKKWLIIGIIAVVLLVLEIAAAVIFVLPGVNRNKMFEALKAGKGEEAAECYSKVKFFAADTIDDEIKGFLVTETNACLEGKKGYDETLKEILAVESIGKYKNKNIEYIQNINMGQLISIYEKGYNDIVMTEGDELFTIWDEFDEVYDISVKGSDHLSDYSDADRDKYSEFIDTNLDEYLKGKFIQFQEGTIDEDGVVAYIEVAQNFFRDDTYAQDLDEELYFVKYYKNAIAEISTMIEEEDYFGAYDAAKECIDNPLDETYSSKYNQQLQDLQDEAYDKGKEYGLKKGLEAAQKEDTNTAQEYVNELKRIYGDSVDVSEIEALIAPGWAKAYKAFVEDIEPNLKAVIDAGIDVKSEGTGDVIFTSQEISYEDLVPNKITIYDFDDNDIPEMILTDVFSGGCYVFTFADGEVKCIFIGTIDGVGDPKYAVTTLSAIESGVEMTIDALMRFDGTECLVEHYVVTADYGGKSYYLVDNLDDVSDQDTYNSMRGDIMAQKKGNLPMGDALSNYEKVISEYK